MNLIRKFIRKLFFNDLWKIGSFKLDSDSIQELKISNLRWYKFTNHDYEADPFILHIDENIFFAFEIFSLTSVYGRLVVFDMDGKEYDFFSEVNKEKRHKSYPYIFYDNSEIYCIPEECDLNELNLYKFNRDSKKFEFKRQLLNENPYIDTNIFKNDDIYFLSTSTLKKPHEQKLFFSENLDGEFKEHPKSPIKISKKYGRNGGFVNYKNKNFRVSQDFSKFYGQKVTLFEINKCTSNDYVETEVLEITPEKLRINFSGIHTLNNSNDFFIFDAKISEFNLLNPIKKLIKRIKLFIK